MADRLHLALIYGSVRIGRFCDTVGSWAAERISERDDFSLDLIDPSVVTPSDGLRQRLEQADAFVFVTPEYNHGYPAPLKAIIDGAKSEWAAKPAAFVSYGGMSGGLRAVEQLRQVLAELHVVGVRDTVSFAFAWDRFDANGQPKEPDGCALAADVMLNQLYWWGQTLKAARQDRPYGRH